MGYTYRSHFLAFPILAGAPLKVNAATHDTAVTEKPKISERNTANIKFNQQRTKNLYKISKSGHARKLT